jgi:hypothetical protein
VFSKQQTRKKEGYIILLKEKNLASFCYIGTTLTVYPCFCYFRTTLTVYDYPHIVKAKYSIWNHFWLQDALNQYLSNAKATTAVPSMHCKMESTR